MLFFNSKTKTLTGELDYISSEEEARAKQLIAEGKMSSTEHPSDEELAEALKAYAGRDMVKEQAEAMRLARERGTSRRVRGGLS